MYDEESAANRWVVRLVKLSVVAVATTIIVWYALQFRRPRRPPAKSPSVQLAILRNRDEKPLARRIAADSIEEADATIVGELKAELSAGDDVGRETAAIALGRVGTEAHGAIDALIAALDDPQPEVRHQAAISLFEALHRLGDAGIGRLVDLLAHADADIRRRSVIELGRAANGRPERLEALRGALNDSDARVRAEAYAALARHKTISLDELIAALHDGDPLVQSTACTLLARMGGDALPAVPEIVKIFARDCPNDAAPDYVPTAPDIQRSFWNLFVRDTFRSAAQALQQFAKADPALIDQLAPLLDAENERTVEETAILIGQLGPASESVRDRLLAHVDSPRGKIADWTFFALHETGLEGRLRPPELFDALETAGDEVHSLILWDPGATTERGYNVTDEDIDRLKGLRQLRLLDLRENPITDAGLKHVAAFEQLERLTLDRTKVTSAGLAWLTGLTKLRRLSLSVCEIDDAGLARLKGLASLEFLDLGRTKVTDAGMRSLAGLVRLKAVRLGGTQVTEAGLAQLSVLPELEDIGSARHYTLRGLALLKGLASVEPTPDSVVDEDLALLAEMPKLRELMLSGSHVTDAGLVHVGKLTQLKKLGLIETAITDAGLEHVAKLTQLEWLGLDQTAITDAGLPRLRTLVNLKSMNVSKTRITDAGLEALQQALPKLEWPLVRSNAQASAMNSPYEVVGLKSEDETDESSFVQGAPATAK